MFSIYFVLDDNSKVSLSASYHHKLVKSAVFTDDRLYPGRGLWGWLSPAKLEPLGKAIKTLILQYQIIFGRIRHLIVCVRCMLCQCCLHTDTQTHLCIYDGSLNVEAASNIVMYSRQL